LLRASSEFAIRIVAGTIALFGLVVMLGWHLGIARVVQLHPVFTPMQYNTALCFLLSGLAALYVRTRNREAAAVSLVVFSIGVLTLIEYVSGRAFGIDELLMRGDRLVATSDPGRMAPQTAIGFVLAGAALATLTLRRAPRYKVIVKVLASLLGALGLAAVVGYCVGLEPAYGWAEFRRIAPHTAIGFIVLSFAVLQNVWRLYSTEKHHGPPLLAIPTGVGALAVTLSLSQALLAWQVERIDDTTARTVERAAGDLEARLRGYVESFGALVAEWARSGGEPQSTWSADVARFLRDQQVFLAVSRGGSDGKLSWIFPEGPYPDHVGFDYSTSERRARWLAVARTGGRAVLTEPLELKSGRAGILIVAPLPAAPGERPAFAVVAALLDELFSPTASSMSAYRLAVFNGESLLYGSEADDGSRTKRARDIQIDGMSLHLEATPLPETIAAISSPLPTVVLVLGLLASLLLAVTAHVAQVSSRRAAALSVANSQLATAKKNLERLALFDELTGLGNRNLLLIEVDKRLAVAQRESVPLPLLLIDLNGFKAINDTFGHEAGDDVLREFAARLVEALPLTSEAFRTGGDEFAVIVQPGTSLDDALSIARAIERATEAPLLLGGEQRVIGASIGIAAYPRHGQERKRLLRAADVAMYQAKHASSGVQIASDDAPTAVLRALQQASR
jgi:diguanylate cyclase (GGDEF)-like protein